MSISLRSAFVAFAFDLRISVLPGAVRRFMEEQASFLDKSATERACSPLRPSRYRLGEYEVIVEAYTRRLAIEGRSAGLHIRIHLAAIRCDRQRALCSRYKAR